MLSKKDDQKKKSSKDLEYRGFKKSLRHYLDLELLNDKEKRGTNDRGHKAMVLKNALNAIVLNN